MTTHNSNANSVFALQVPPLFTLFKCPHDQLHANKADAVKIVILFYDVTTEVWVK